MTEREEGLMFDRIKEVVRKVRDTSMLQGIKSSCGAILDMAQEEGKGDKEKLDEIIGFCQRSLKIKKE